VSSRSAPTSNKPKDLDAVAIVSEFAVAQEKKTRQVRIADSYASSILSGMFHDMERNNMEWDHSFIVRAMYDVSVNLFPSSDKMAAALSSMFEHCSARVIPEALDVLLSAGAAQVDIKRLISIVLKYLDDLLVQLEEAASSNECDFEVLIEEQVESLLSVLLRYCGDDGLGFFVSHGERFVLGNFIRVCEPQSSI